ncbi:hypothetical protein E2C01_057142 [Portunus trituberculatus]|uniref:Uncharacterized protein n=1 Tax=Portunus trituberculatus TaxID=210409 RepID=A0A5B7GSM5_PORTR|nr:hypothetical protein [Portunus trituberculatus]
MPRLSLHGNNTPPHGQEMWRRIRRVISVVGGRGARVEVRVANSIIYTWLERDSEATRQRTPRGTVRAVSRG